MESMEKKKRKGKTKGRSHRSLRDWIRGKRGEEPASSRSESSVQAATGLPCDALSTMMLNENENEFSNTGLGGVIEPTPVSDKISLWDRAYDALAAEDPKLIQEYDAVLCLPSGSHSSKASRQNALTSAIRDGVQVMDDKRIKYRFRGETFILEEQVTTAIDIVLAAKNVVSAVVSSSAEASLAWAGVCLILPLFTNPSTAKAANEVGLAYVTGRVRYYTALEPKLFPASIPGNQVLTCTPLSELERQVVTLYQNVLHFQIKSVLRFHRNGLKNWSRDVIQYDDWKGMLDQVKDLENKVHQGLTEISALSQSEELTQLNEATKKVEGRIMQLLSVQRENIKVAEENRDINAQILRRQIEADKDRLTRDELDRLQLFHITDYQRYKDRVEDRLEGTCEWFLSHENYKEWLEHDSNLLLVSADPGCGKSVLSKFLIDHQLPRSATICYFFFKDQDQNTLKQALCSLIHQLLCNSPAQLRTLGRFTSNTIEMPSDLESIFKQLLIGTEDKELIIVLDALDECTEGGLEDLVHLVKSDHLHQIRNVKFLLTARPYYRITSKFQGFLEEFPKIRIPGEHEDQSQKISKEINRVINYRVAKLNLKNPFKNHLQQRLLEIQHRTYLWVHLIFEHFTTRLIKRTETAIDSAIRALPESLDEAYEDILRQGNDHKLARTALSIMLAAYRPLSIRELNTAVNFTTESHCLGDIDLEDDDDFETRLRDACGLFVSVYGGKVDFLHQTARQFLLDTQVSTDQRRGGHQVWKESIQVEPAHSKMTEMCTRFLNFPDYVNPFDHLSMEVPTDNPPLLMDNRMKIMKEVDSWLLQQNSFVSYASEFWVSHARDAGSIPEAARYDYEKLCEDTGNVSTRPWVIIRGVVTRRWMAWRVYEPSRRSPAALQASFGHLSELKQTMEAGRLSENDKDNYYFALLKAACGDARWCEERHRQPVVDFLLSLRPKHDTGNVQMAQLASSLVDNRDECHPIIPKLLHGGALFSGSNDWHKNCELLHDMVKGGCVILLDLALSHCFDPIEGDWVCGHLRFRHQEIILDPWICSSPDAAQVKLKYQEGLLRRFDPNCRCHGGGKTLLHDAQQGHSARALIQHGADVEARDNRERTPLFVIGGAAEFMEILLENGADVNARDELGQSPLFAAGIEGWYHIIERLLAAGGDIEARDHQGRTALIVACDMGKFTGAKWLIRLGADVEARDNAGNHPKALGGAKFHSIVWHSYRGVGEMHLCNCGVEFDASPRPGSCNT